MPKVSVIVPVYKIPTKYLRACIESIQKQTVTDLEIFLIDDGSPDDCGKVCDDYAAEDTRIRVIHQKNQGVSAARNAALQVISGEYFTFVDADDSIDPETFATAVKALEEENAQCAVFGWKEIKEKKEISSEKETQDILHKVTKKKQVISAQKVWTQIASDNLLCGGGYPWNKMWKTSVLRQSDGTLPLFELTLHTYEDKVWILQVLLRQQKVVLLPDILYQYNYLATGLTKNDDFWENRIFNGLNAYEIIIEMLKNDPVAQKGALRFYNIFLTDETFYAWKGHKWNRGHFQRMKQYWYMHRSLVSLKYVKGWKKKIKYIILLAVFWCL